MFEKSDPVFTAQDQAMVIRICMQVGRTSLTNDRSYHELLGAAWRGWREAKEKFDPERSDNFPAFAYSFIRGRIVDELRSEMPYSRSLHGHIKKYQALLDSGIGRNEAIDQVTESMTDPGKCSFYSALLSYESVASEDSDIDPVQSVPDQTIAHPSIKMDEERRNAELQRVIRTYLTWTERTVIGYVYFEGHRIREVAQYLGTSESNVSVISKGAVRKMAHYLSGAAA